MTFRICVIILFLLTISSSLAINEDETGTNSLKAHGRGTDCQNVIGCPTSPYKGTPQCQDHRDCRMQELCHSFLKVCFVRQTEQSKMKLKKTKPKTPSSCKVDGDCRQNQTCHVFFAICVDKPRIQTTVATNAGSTVQMCGENSDCPKGQYCHDFFNMCLPNLTNHLEPTISSPRTGCKSMSDCKSGEFCHGLTGLCLPLPTAAKTRTTPKSSHSCSSHADCKITEFCHFLIGMRHHDQTRRVQDKGLSSPVGVCINRALKEVPKDRNPISLNCSKSADCGEGRCCLRELGLCVGYRLPGQLCLAENVSFAFSCPCLRGFTCVSRRRPMRLKRLERKLKLPKEATKRLNSHMHKTTELKVGKCENTSD